MSEEVDIKGVDKAELLAALYNNAEPMGMGFLQARSGDMSVEDAQVVISNGTDDYPGDWKNTNLYFDYVYGRPLKVDLSGDVVRSDLYDRDWGVGECERIVEELKKKAGV